MQATAKRLRAARERINESQGKFAKRFGIDRSTYNGWENGKLPKEGTAPILIERVLAELAASEAA